MPLPSHAHTLRLRSSTGLCCLTLLGLMLVGLPARAQRPNVVLIMADDLGYGDLALYGSTEPQTPNLDALGRSGLQFTDFYVAPVCTPSRFALVTGLDVNRSRDELFSPVAPNQVDKGLRPGETTMGDYFQEAGYRTGLIGKWHLGHGNMPANPPSSGAPDSPFHPNNHGFDDFYGFLSGLIDYNTHWNRSNWLDWFENKRYIEDEDGLYATDRFSDRAVSFIEAHTHEPFFLYVPYNAAHNPLQLPPGRESEYLARFDHLEVSTTRKKYLAMISIMDEGVGRILDALDRTGQADHTIVVFLSDNGGIASFGGSNAPLRGEKHSLLEGGTRVPALIRWPGVIPAGTVSDQPAQIIDWLPTLLGLAGLPRAATDGIDLSSHLRGGPPIARDVFYANPSHGEFYRQGRWKYVRRKENSLAEELFDLEADPGETTDLAAAEPEKLAELRALHQARLAWIEGNAPPEAVIAATPASGAPPLAVSFDGSGSGDADGEVLWYGWDFGDGSQGRGPRVEHTYETPGTYTARLVVGDDVGAKDTTYTTLTVTSGNAPPEAVFETNPENGQAPLQVTFEATDSSDPDGEIVSYAWDFGDGWRANGVSVSHTYALAGTYTARLTVTDDQGAGAEATHLITVNPLTLSRVIGEAGTVTVAQADRSQWHRVDFSRTYSRPAVVLQPISFNEKSPTTARVRNLSGSGFELQVQEWDYLDGAHPAETVPYLVVEAGSHRLDDGRLLQAGFAEADSDEGRVDFPSAFAGPPIVLGQVVTTGDPKAVATRLYEATATGFTLKLQSQELDPAHGAETVAWVALSPGTGSTGGRVIEARLTPDAAGNLWYGIDFGHAFAEAPVFVAAMQRIDGTDPSVLRYRSLTAGRVEVKVEEEQSKDAETGHTHEVVGYLALRPGLILTDTPPPNQAPEAAFTATPDAGPEPLEVAFDAAASHDPDGEITGYAWDFGDGATASGLTASHSYTAAGTYTARLSVSDDQGAAAEATHLITVDPSGPSRVIGEAGMVTVAQADRSVWHRVDFSRAYSRPVVVLQPVSFNEKSPTTVRVRGLGPTGFELQVQEWDYLDGVHPSETVPYLAVEAGSHRLDDGRLLQAGLVEAGSNELRVDLGSGFGTVPVVLSQVVTTNEARAVATRQYEVTPDGFSLKLQSQELDPSHGVETVAFVALAPGTGSTGGRVLEAALTPDAVGNLWYDLAFGGSFTAAPVFVAAMQRMDGSDPSVLRYRSLTEGQVEIKVEEEQSKDAETGHTHEVVGYVAVEAGPIIVEEGPAPSSAAPAAGRKPGSRLPGLHEPVGAAASVPEAYALEGAYPNPFNPTTRLRYALPEAGHAELRVYDVLGRQVAVLVDQAREAGRYEAAFDASALPSGVYFAELRVGVFRQVRNLLLLK